MSGTLRSRAVDDDARAGAVLPASLPAKVPDTLAEPLVSPTPYNASPAIPDAVGVKHVSPGQRPG